jgi:L-fuculose-phosphate aldolase
VKTPAPKTAPAGAVAIARICRRLYERGYVVATEGNVSVRLASGDVLITGTRVPKASIGPSDIVKLSPAGRKLSGAREPSSEARLHLTIYAARPDVGAIVHAHPPYCTAFAVARKELDVEAMPETVVEFGKIPLVPFAVPSTGALSTAIGPYLAGSDFFLLANHGVVSCGAVPEEAYEKVERAEHAARILLLARLLGGVKKLGRRELAALNEIRERRKS